MKLGKTIIAAALLAAPNAGAQVINQCLTCPRGKYCVSGNTYSCSAGYTSDLASTSASDCYICPEGYNCGSNGPAKCQSGYWSRTGTTTSCTALVSIPKSWTNETYLEPVENTCQEKVLTPGVYRIELRGGNGGNGGSGDNSGGAGGAGTTMTYNFIVKDEVSARVCRGKHGANGGNGYDCTSGKKWDGSTARCGRRGVSGVASHISFKDKSLVFFPMTLSDNFTIAGSGGGGGGSGGWYYGFKSGSIVERTSYNETGESGSAGTALADPFVTASLFTSYLGAGGSSASNGNGKAGSPGSKNVSANYAPEPYASAPARATLYKYNSKL